MTRTFRSDFWVASLASVCLAAFLTASFAQSIPSSQQKSYMVEVPGTRQWIDTGIDLRGSVR